MDNWEKRKEQERSRCDYFESYLSAMKRRLNLQMIGGYIRDGGNKTILSNDGFRDREARAFVRLEKRLREKCDKEGFEELVTQVNAYTAVVQEIYFSLGMKTGAILHAKLTDNFETDI